MKVYQLKADPKVKKYTSDDDSKVLGWNNGPVEAPTEAWDFLGTREQVSEAARQVNQTEYAFWIRQGLSAEEATRRSKRVA